MGEPTASAPDAPTADVAAAARDPRLVPLWAELARRLGASARPVRRIRLSGLDADAREALAGLLRAPRLPPADLTVSTARIAAAYGLDDAGLRRLVETVHGPVGDRASIRAAAEADRLAGHVALVEQVLATIAVADPARPTPLPVAAARSLHDPHALDFDQRAGRLLTAALAARAGVDEVTGAVRRRDLLRGAGLVDDELSSTVLVWRMTAADYRAARPSAVAFAPAEVPATSWDPPLAAAMADRGRAVFEETIIGTLLGQ